MTNTNVDGRKMILTVDVEEDISTYLRDSYFGLTEGVPLLLDLFDDLDVKACFFLQGRVCEKFPQIVAQISQAGHQIGTHSYDHEMMYFRTSRWQYRQVEHATRAVEAATRLKPRLFRAPRFSATSKTIRVLERLGYTLDSSILPDSSAKFLRGMVTIRSTKGAPRLPYHPDSRDILRPGSSAIWEVPVTVNPIFPGAPLTMGGLNTFGVPEMVRAIGLVTEPVAVFIIHPWECVDLGHRYPGLKDWVKRLCAPNREGLTEFLTRAERMFRLGTFDLLRLPSDGARGA